MATQFELAYRNGAGGAAWNAILLTTDYEKALKLALHLHAIFDCAIQITLMDAEHTLVAIWSSRPMIHPSTA